MDGAELIAQERQRQIDQEGWTADHDDDHDGGQLCMAAACYVKSAWDTATCHSQPGVAPIMWPWSEKWWKPTGEPIRDLTKAGALIAAEIDRLQRQGN